VTEAVPARPLVPWAVIAAVVTGFGALQTAGWWTVHPRAPLRLTASWLLIDQLGAWYWVALYPAVRALVARVPFTAGHLRRAVPVHALAAILAAFGHTALSYATAVLLGFARPSAPIRALNWLDLNLVCYACCVAVVSGLGAREVLRARRAEADRRQAALTAAELDALNAQLQPHSLFNALNVLAELVHESPAAARALVRDLRGLLDASFRDGQPAEVPLREEVALARSFLGVQQRRFGARLKARVDVAPALAEVPVPRLLLQPLVENAVRHGVSARGDGTVTVAAQRTAARLRLSVTDDGDGPREEFAEGVGIRNVRARLQCLYGTDHAFDLRRRARGTEAVVEIPLRAAP
jgi:anti-sigma regulatory factor (Ser/Thr protein kinase)